MKLPGLSLLFLAGVASAENAYVEQVQMPAWLERGGVRTPLAPRLTLQEYDRIITGKGARVYLQMPEGSRVKLGENTDFKLTRLDEGDGQHGSVFKSAMKVLTGAFRFTTSALGKTAQRDVSVTVSNVTAGIRGTDLWGKAAADKNWVCLLEGKITAGAEGYPLVEMNEPLTFYVAPHNADPLPVGPVDPEMVKKWAAETEIAGQEGVISGEGAWQVTLASFRQSEQAAALLSSLQAAGFPVKISHSGRPLRHQIVLSGLDSEADARNTVVKVRSVLTTPLAEITVKK